MKIYNNISRIHCIWNIFETNLEVTSYETWARIVFADGNRNRKDEIDSRVCHSWWHEIGGGKKKERFSWTTLGHSSVKSTSRGCHGMERAGRAESRRRGRDEWVLGESAYTPRSLHPPSSSLHPLSPLCLFADTLAPIGNGAFGLDAAPYRWRVECYSIMTTRCQSWARVISLSPFLSLFHLTPSQRIDLFLRSGFHPLVWRLLWLTFSARVRLPLTWLKFTIKIVITRDAI